MAEKLDFSLPQKKSSVSVTGVLTVVLLIVLIGLAAANLVIALPGSKRPVTSATQGLTPEQTKELAAKLAQRNLYRQSATAWQEYLTTTPLSEADRAKVLFQAGTALENAGQYAEAVECYYRSEMTASVAELSPQINAHVKDCLTKLGKFSALRYELMDRTSMKSSETAGGKVVAEIGTEKITEADLDAQIERAIDNQLASVRAFVTSDQLNEQKKKMLEQYRTPQKKQEFLQNWLAQEALYRQALNEGMSDKPETKRVLEDVTRGVLSQQMMNERLASRIHITDADLQTYYTANKGQYMEPAGAKISHMRVGEQKQADELLKRLKAGEDFAKVAAETPGGKMTEDVVKGEPVPGIGDANGLSEAIVAAQAPALLDMPFKTDKGWEIVRVEEKRAERQKNFDEARQQVTMDLAQRKRQEVQQEYLREMMDKYNVVIHTSVLNPAAQDTSKTK
jgi:parvulin-like peptidyl-prolyl isomerase